MRGGADPCPHCGAPADVKQPEPFLPLRTVLGGRYLIGRVSYRGSDGVMYIAWDAVENRPVCINEFFPETLAFRAYTAPQAENGGNANAVLVMNGCEPAYADCMASFLQLWRTLEKIPPLTALPRVSSVFEENGTAYAVSEYIEEQTLRNYLLQTPQGFISFEKARPLLMPVLSAVEAIHEAGILHRGISPNTLMVGEDGKVRLRGFEIWQARTAHGGLTADLSPGYAAAEQYASEEAQGPWTDIYAFGAVLYRCLVGTDPEDALSRCRNDKLMIPARFAEQIPAYALDGLVGALQIYAEGRTRTADQLRQELSAAPTVILTGGNGIPERKRPNTAERNLAAAAALAGTEPEQKKPLTGAQVTMRTILIVLLVALLAAVAFFVFSPTYRERFFSALGGKEAVTESTTAAQIPMPTFVGQFYSKELTGRYAGQLSFTVTNEADASHDAGIIVAQSVAPDELVDLGTQVILVVSSGAPGKIVPNVVGKGLVEAESDLTALGFLVEYNTQENAEPSKDGIVISSYPAAGEELKPGETVFLEVYGNADGSSLEADPSLTEPTEVTEVWTAIPTSATTAETESTDETADETVEVTDTLPAEED
jgi:serine/threonine-protein kinase